MTRFFVDPQAFDQDYIYLTGENAAHAKVLRLKCGEEVVVCNGQGCENLCAVTEVSDNKIILSVVSKNVSESEAKVQVSIYTAFSKGDKLEHIIQKATELGAIEIVAFPSARCVSKPDEKSLRKKIERWQKIASSAAEQSGRGCIPAVIVLNSYKKALVRAAEADIAILFYENERSKTLRKALSDIKYTSVSLITGPEGGLESREVEMAIESGIQVCTLGRRILRCETAPLCALSAVMYDAGEF